MVDKNSALCYTNLINKHLTREKNKMENVLKFAVIGDCHHSYKQNYGSRDCLGANKRLSEIIDILNQKDLDFVFSMGDLGDGHSVEEAPAVLETFANVTCR